MESEGDVSNAEFITPVLGTITVHGVTDEKLNLTTPLMDEDENMPTQSNIITENDTTNRTALTTQPLNANSAHTTATSLEVSPDK